ncbi:MAG: LAGLIDADG family homing endonuclease [Patescibacteria group bacterium]
MTVDKCNLAYIIGIALGDGNLSRPNKRATRLRITCDTKYPLIINDIVRSLGTLFPKNKVSVNPGPKSTYSIISVYSNTLDTYMPWRVGHGSKYTQNAHVPDWVKCDPTFCLHCIRGLIQTDGSIYYDRGYKMLNFVNNTLDLAIDVKVMFETLGYAPRFYTARQSSGKPKYTVRLAKNVDQFIKKTNLHKD